MIGRVGLDRAHERGPKGLWFSRFGVSPHVAAFAQERYCHVIRS